MTKTTKIVLGIVLALAVVLGIAYAAITATTGTITGKANADGNQGEFKVNITSDPAITTGSTEGVTIEEGSVTTSGLTSKFTINGLTKKGDKAVVTYTVKNESDSNLGAILKQTGIEYTNETYFTVSSSLITNQEVELGNGSEKVATITITLNKTPIEAQSTTITLNLSASPVEE